MKKFGDFIVKNKIIILIVCLLALIPAIIGMIETKINYNILVYLPDDIETMKGQKILTDDFKLGSFSVSILDNMSPDDALKFEKKVEKIDGVNRVVSLYDVVGTEIPIEMLPEEVQDKLAKGDSTLLLTTFDNGVSDEETMDAVAEIRKLADDTVKVGGMTAMVLDTKNLSDSEVTTYVVIAVICCIFVLMLALDSYTVPFILLLNIGAAVLYNMGTNWFLGDISYITKAISSILQLGVTTDFSIFLYHQYEYEKKLNKDKNEAMSKAIGSTLNSIIGSSTTTIAGFLALCTMQLTLGTDIGVVMAKGVLFGVITVVTLFPALILFFDKIITRTEHKPVIPEFKHVKNFVAKKYKLIFAIFLLLIIPAWWGQKNTEVYYNLDRTLPSTLASSVANKELEKKYNIVSPMIILASKDLSANEINNMMDDIKALGNIDYVISYTSLSDLNVPDEMIDSDVKSLFESDKYYLILVSSNYEKATTKLNNQIDKINKIVKSYDKNSIVAGEGALTKDLVEISNTDFHNVNYTSLGVILVIILLVLGSYTLPIILISVIEVAIFINMGIPYYTGTTIPFVSSIVIGTIQLGATIDYAILMTNKYLEKRKAGIDKNEAIKYALDNSVSSIFTSGMCFFAATFGVGIYSDLEMVGSLCSLIARGAIISMLMVILVLPSLLMIFDKIICKTTKGFKKGDNKNMKKSLKLASIALISSLLIPFNVNAMTKQESVYVKENNTGAVTKTIVSEHLVNSDDSTLINDFTNLTKISNTNGKETYKLDGNSLTWNSNGNDIYYKGLTNKSLPINMNITYNFEGKDYNDFSKIEGKKGHVKITVKLTNNEKHGNLYTPFTTLLTTSLNNTKNRNIKVVNGTVESNGTKSVVVGIAMPGLSQSLDLNELSNLNQIVIEYDTTSFDTVEMYALITPKFLNINNATSELDSLYSNMDTLNNSSTELVNGSKELKNGLDELNASYADFNSKLAALDGASNDLSKAYNEKLNNSIIQINAGMTELNGSITSLATGMNTLENSTKEFYTYMSTLDNSLSADSDSSKATAAALTDIYTKAMTNPNLSDTDRATLQSELNTIKTNNDTLKASVDSLTASALKLYQSVAYMNSLIQASQTNSKTLVNGSTALTGYMSQLTTGSTEFSKSLSYYSQNMDAISAASTSKVSTGITKLDNGSTELYNGMSKFDSEGIKVLYNTINTTVKGKVNNLKELNNLSKNYTSFGGATSNTSSETKFIVRISK